MRIYRRSLEKVFYSVLKRPLIVHEEGDTIYYKGESLCGVTFCIEYKKNESLLVMAVDNDASYIEDELLQSLMGFFTFTPIRFFERKKRSDFPIILAAERDFVVDGYRFDFGSFSQERGFCIEEIEK